MELPDVAFIVDLEGSQEALQAVRLGEGSSADATSLCERQVDGAHPAALTFQAGSSKNLRDATSKKAHVPPKASKVRLDLHASMHIENVIVSAKRS